MMYLTALLFVNYTTYHAQFCAWKRKLKQDISEISILNTGKRFLKLSNDITNVWS